ncbi:hypothetical protein J6590_043862 [Homalodisca vitripennis]|nr:hypothetical protein J6590_043862 [Homalodisca vitripennis]
MSTSSLDRFLYWIMFNLGTIRSADVPKPHPGPHRLTASHNKLAGAIAPRGVTEVDDADYAVESVFTMKVISQQEIFNVVISLRGRSATGWDDIPT